MAGLFAAAAPGLGVEAGAGPGCCLRPSRTRTSSVLPFVMLGSTGKSFLSRLGGIPCITSLSLGCPQLALGLAVPVPSQDDAPGAGTGCNPGAHRLQERPVPWIFPKALAWKGSFEGTGGWPCAVGCSLWETRRFAGCQGTAEPVQHRGSPTPPRLPCHFRQTVLIPVISPPAAKLELPDPVVVLPASGCRDFRHEGAELRKLWASPGPWCSSRSLSPCCSLHNSFWVKNRSVSLLFFFFFFIIVL